MSHHVRRLKPLLLELDEVCPLDRPVLVDAHLIPLFKKHGERESIELIPVPAAQVRGLHLGHAPSKTAVIIYPRCEIHHGGQVDGACPGCQEARYTIAKELVHCLDRKEDKTSPDHMASDLINQLVRREWSESPQAFADGWGELWAIELLARFRHRLLVRGNASVPRSLRLATAVASNNYFLLASQYGAPDDAIKRAFSDGYMDLMRTIRMTVQLPVEMPALVHAAS